MLLSHCLLTFVITKPPDVVVHCLLKHLCPLLVTSRKTPSCWPSPPDCDVTAKCVRFSRLDYAVAALQVMMSLSEEQIKDIMLLRRMYFAKRRSHSAQLSYHACRSRLQILLQMQHGLQLLRLKFVRMPQGVSNFIRRQLLQCCVGSVPVGHNAQGSCASVPW